MIDVLDENIFRDECKPQKANPSVTLKRVVGRF